MTTTTLTANRKAQVTDMQLSGDYLVQLANQYGTPLYVYHAEKIKQQFERLTTAFNKSDVTFFLRLQGTYQHQYTSVYKQHWLQCRLQFI